LGCFRVQGFTADSDFEERWAKPVRGWVWWDLAFGIYG
jgi:hypothetical protein